jgi:eukaryotic-like serine/threonine-protein kinase
MKTVPTLCGTCGATISDDATTGQICPACLLEAGIGPLDEDSLAAPLAKDLGAGDFFAVALAKADNGAPEVERKKATRTAKILGDFGDYELLEEIGRGGQGVVYCAHQKSLNRTVALKVIGLGPWTTERHLKRFHQEAEAAAHLDHPCIVPVYEVGERDAQCYFSMKFIKGGQLDEVVRHTPMSIPQSAELVAKVARTIDYAHEHGILHRDIKPANILLDKNGEPHLTDFGLARLVEADSTVTGTLEVLGTPSYMAPEQAAGERTKVSKATDVYGLGAVLYQLLTGQPPFAGGTTYETIRLLRDTEARPPRVINPRVDRDLSTICLKCLEKDPKRRYSSALALAEDLERRLRHEPIQARRIGVLSRGGKWVRRNPTSALLAASLIALATTAGWIVWKTEFIRHPVTKGIAVLPFENLSGDPNNAYFAEGIQEEILTRLAKIADLKVISRTSTHRYHSKPGNLAEIAKQLGVANILEGSVQKAADEVRVNVQLINAQTDSHLWAETYDRKLTDILGIESEIAKRIAESLQAKLTGSEEQVMSKNPTENTEAYELYLKGRFFWNKRTGVDLRKAIEYFGQAVSKDPNYALAYAGLADSYQLLSGYGAASPQDSIPQTKAAVKRALELDDTLGEAHATWGRILAIYDFEFDRAIAEFERAIRLNSNYAMAHHWFGMGPLTALGQFDRAIAEGKRAVELDPLSLIDNADFGLIYFNARRYDEAIAQLRKTIDMDSRFYVAHYYLGQALQFKGQLTEAIAEYRTAVELDDDPVALAFLGHAYARAGQRNEAQKILDRLTQEAKSRYVSAYSFALVLTGLGDKDGAIEALERAYLNDEGHDIFMVKVDPMLDDLRGQARFEALVQKVAQRATDGELKPDPN